MKDSASYKSIKVFALLVKVITVYIESIIIYIEIFLPKAIFIECFIGKKNFLMSLKFEYCVDNMLDIFLKFLSMFKGMRKFYLFQK